MATQAQIVRPSMVPPPPPIETTLDLPAQFFAPAPKRLPPEIEAQLLAPLPEKALSDHPTMEGFTAIEVAFVVERLNQVFGIGGWREAYRKSADSYQKTVIYHKGTPEQREEEIWTSAIHGAFYIPEFGIYGEAFGGSDNKDLGDAEKGGCSDALKRWASHLGIGLYVYLSGRKSLMCPDCGKKLRKDKEGGYYCWRKKDGCGATFTAEGLKAAQERKANPVQPDIMKKSPQGVAAKEAGPQPGPAAVPPQKPVASSQNGTNGKTQQPVPTQDPSKTTQAGTATECKIDKDAFWLKLVQSGGELICVTKNPDIIDRLNTVEGKKVELLVSPLSGQSRTVYMIHKVCAVYAKGVK
ncbi:MAG TPA: Rad52/Rad22 family DNA repair protein [Candidatus Angelobacter sp.]|nr:Rad52/Rad22 family DNA repair protein [Candidatus Angelobacter sp.]